MVIEGKKMKEHNQQIILTIGLPASGKTTWATEFVKNNPHFININRDDIRRMINGSPKAKFRPKKETLVTNMQKEMAEEAFLSGYSIIISDTNLNPKTVESWKKFAYDRGIPCNKQKFTDVPHGVCIERDKVREDKVGTKVIMGMYNRYRDQFPKVPVYNKELNDCYIVDIDGTLAHMHDRGPFEWHKVGQDLPIESVIDVIKSLQKTNNIIFMSGRDAVCRKETTDWLHEHGLSCDVLFMRPEGSMEKDYVVKENLYKEHVKGNFNVLGIFDDRDQVVHLWRHLGFQVFQCNYGDF